MILCPKHWKITIVTIIRNVFEKILDIFLIG